MLRILLCLFIYSLQCSSGTPKYRTRMIGNKIEFSLMRRKETDWIPKPMETQTKSYNKSRYKEKSMEDIQSRASQITCST